MSGGFRRGFRNQFLIDQTNRMQSNHDATINLNVRMIRQMDLIIDWNNEKNATNAVSKFSMNIPPKSTLKKDAAIILDAWWSDFIDTSADSSCAFKVSMGKTV